MCAKKRYGYKCLIAMTKVVFLASFVSQLLVLQMLSTPLQPAGHTPGRKSTPTVTLCLTAAGPGLSADHQSTEPEPNVLEFHDQSRNGARGVPAG